MLHEILLSLSGHPSPLLRPPSSPEADALAGISPPERQLLSSAGHISHLHTKLIAYSSETATSHPSTICRAVCTAISSVHLAAFQRKVLDVEASVLRNDAGLVGAYNIVPLTAVMSEFQQWTRRLEWLWDTVRFIMARDGEGRACRGAALIDRLRDELQSGYQDVAATAESLVKAAETAWLKQVSAWVLYGRLPSFGADDFFVQTTTIQGATNDRDYVCMADCLPSFVTGATASSMLFIGKSLHHVRSINTSSTSTGVAHVAAKLSELSTLSLPLESTDFSKAIKAIRTSLSETTLQQMLPLAKVSEMMHLLREFFLLGRGEFAMALTHEADEKIRNRWRRAVTGTGNHPSHLAHDNSDQSVKNVTVKDGEVAAVLNRTWAVLVSMQGQHAEEDDQLDLARSLIQLHLTKARPPAALATGRGLDMEAASHVAASPFRNMLFGVPAMLSIDLPSPLDMVISASDLQLYSSINSYLLSLRRAHIRLTDLWKITSLRRHYPSPRGTSDYAVTLRERWSDRAWLLRSSWTTASAAIFFLGETEAYFQTEIVAGLWDHFHTWLLPPPSKESQHSASASRSHSQSRSRSRSRYAPFSDPITPTFNKPTLAPSASSSHDPETLSTAHTLYLRTLTHRLLLTQPSFTQPLYALLTHIDHLATHLHRLHSLFTSSDLHHDAGVLDTTSSSDRDREQGQLFESLHTLHHKVKNGIQDAVHALRALESDPSFLAEWDGQALAEPEEGEGEEHMGYIPARVGGVDRLLMKLDFGSWISG
ncbi:uncharacterized protein CPUR_07505 [Claviceps purpurea 20.1]|uniref:Spindle pole body component n=1 Tax=Claviceps purpurea (strain 20.1) TaxID=1111077 RepID=M1WHZ3_CLAP2|nr:hypothetical protein E4U50_005046 [Claviceps purpurea]CCE33579.1 uncharacterized protein CPUR_07505 [Claviceps purpurea 20.1]